MHSDTLPAKLPLPDALRAAAIPLDHLGVLEVAWTREKALEVVATLEGTTWAILGGDVLVQRSGAYWHSYDTWHSDPAPDELCLDFVPRSHRETRSYIEASSDEFAAYVLVFAPCEAGFLISRDK